MPRVAAYVKKIELASDRIAREISLTVEEADDLLKEARNEEINRKVLEEDPVRLPILFLASPPQKRWAARTYGIELKPREPDMGPEFPNPHMTLEDTFAVWKLPSNFLESIAKYSDDLDELAKRWEQVEQVRCRTWQRSSADVPTKTLSDVLVALKRIAIGAMEKDLIVYIGQALVEY